MKKATPYEAGLAEQSFRELVQELIHNAAGKVEIDYASKILEAASEGVLERTLSIGDLNERIDAFADAEFLIESALRLGLYGGERLLKALNTEKARKARGKNDKARIADQKAFLRETLGDRTVERPYKIADELFGSPGAAADLNKKAKEAGVESFSLSTLRRRLTELKYST